MSEPFEKSFYRLLGPRFSLPPSLFPDVMLSLREGRWKTTVRQTNPARERTAALVNVLYIVDAHHFNVFRFESEPIFAW